MYMRVLGGGGGISTCVSVLGGGLSTCNALEPGHCMSVNS